ncbi:MULTISPECIES: lactococcin 972 family bacteriocin [unclassified Streptomyces]|uniref:lactococcin 972 family bacteriocin n=1 Tax=unclassified Streptomyces TaxID=2593676 RepID=UPI00168ABF5B|nr:MULTISPECIES: lactococcin 972 family bacteriocin [unclassified Streptomyces]MBD3005161.1 lactococcin 972 family bacteriocin [Streptomyces sp. 5-10]
MRKTIAKFGVAVGGLILVTATPALATITYPPEGGTWDHGISPGIVWSNYQHDSKCHGSTSVGAYTDRSPNTPAGQVSYTSANAKVSGNKAYYRIC